MPATSIGDMLQTERLRLRRSLEDIEAETKIGRPILEALETNRFDLIPGGSYGRNFVRQYATALGIDAHQAIAAYREQHQEPPLPLPVPPRTRPRRRVHALVCLLLAAGGLAG